jgi:hypothetical protein
MKKIQTIVLPCFLIALLSCAEHGIETDQEKISSVDNASSSVSAASSIGKDNPFKKTVGGPVTQSITARWIDNYKKQHGLAKTYSINPEKLTNILSMPSCNGISMHYARDEKFNLHILPIGVDASGKIMATENVATENGDIDWATAQQWINNYSGLARSHFFGANTFERLIHQQEGITVFAELALDDKMAPVILLSNDKTTTTGNDKQDVSAVCPPACPL